MAVNYVCPVCSEDVPSLRWNKTTQSWQCIECEGENPMITITEHPCGSSGRRIIAHYGGQMHVIATFMFKENADVAMLMAIKRAMELGMRVAREEISTFVGEMTPDVEISPYTDL